MAAPKNIIILTQTADIHGCAVDYVLRCLGMIPCLVDTDNILQSQAISVKFGGGDKIHLELGGFSADLGMILSSWNRRISARYNLSDSTLKEDETFIRKNADLYVKGFLSLLDEKFPVNHSSALFASSNKVRQMRWAEECGIRAPDTLISNKADEILEFLDAHSDVCVKPYVGHNWLTDDGLLVINNSRISRDMINDVRDLEVVPHIYQSFIRKKFEYRLTIFGNYSVATRIRTTELSSHSAIDWRVNMEYLSHLEPVRLDDRVIGACTAILRKLGLRFGTFDLAEDEDSNFYFFEVNQAGQWLWQEQHCPDCVLLEPFARYLASADDNFAWDKSEAREEFGAPTVLRDVLNDPVYKPMLGAKVAADESFITDERSLSLDT